MPQFATLEETVALEALCAPPVGPLLVQDLIVTKQCSQHCIFASDYNAKGQNLHSRLINTRDGTLYNNFLQSNYKIIGLHTPTHFQLKYSTGGPNIATIRTTAENMYTGSVETLSSDHNTVFLVMDLEPHEQITTRMYPSTVKWAYYNQLLQKEIPGNPTITSAEEMDAAVTSLTSTAKSAKIASKLYHVHTLRNTAMPDLE